ncbi:MAG TPA: TlpA disulfide reductase family protein [Trebonia sp.]|nr:TlpA disulfide reductase family protein [Trebonia sp.]
MPLRPLRLASKRKAVVSLAAVAAVLLAGGLWAGLRGGGTPSGQSYVDGNPDAVIYAAGHRAALPEFSGTTLAGARLTSATYRGQVLVLNFWGSWCSPCRSEGPTLAALSTRYQHAGVSFLGVDTQDTPTNAEAFEQGFGIKYPSLNDPGNSVAQVIGGAVPVSATPTTLVIDRTDHVAGAIFGTATYSVLNDMLSKVAA